jgi:hypothetical protein
MYKNLLIVLFGHFDSVMLKLEETTCRINKKGKLKQVVEQVNQIKIKIDNIS